jgi:uncharacterized protein involved in exopolysaccharide biosynthesis
MLNGLPAVWLGFLRASIDLNRRFPTVSRWAITGAVIGAIVSGILPRRFDAETSFVIQQKRSGSSVASLVQQIGFAVGEGDAASGAFYVDLAKTDALLRNIASAPLRRSDGLSLSLPDHYRIRKSGSARRMDDAIDRLRDRLDVSFNNKSGIIRVRAEDEDSLVVVELLNRLPDELDRFNQLRRKSQARAEREFLEGRAAAVSSDLAAAEDALRLFKERNRMSNSPMLQVEQDRLNRQLQTKQTLFVTLAQNLEQARIEEVRNTPVLSLVDAAHPPSKPRSRYFVVSVLLGLITGGLLAVVPIMLRPVRGDE